MACVPEYQPFMDSDNNLDHQVPYNILQNEIVIRDTKVTALSS